MKGKRKATSWANTRVVMPIPEDFPVQPLKRYQKAVCRFTCGHCKLSWDDAKVTSFTPTPAGRCPFEDFHIYADADAFSPPLDPGIEKAVLTLRAAGLRTYESCQGGPGHVFYEPTVRFMGDQNEGYVAVNAATKAGLSVRELRRFWTMLDGELCGPWWEMTFDPVKGKP